MGGLGQRGFTQRRGIVRCGGAPRRWLTCGVHAEYARQQEKKHLTPLRKLPAKLRFCYPNRSGRYKPVQWYHPARCLWPRIIVFQYPCPAVSRIIAIGYTFDLFCLRINLPKIPIKWAFFRIGRRSKSVGLCSGSDRARATSSRWPRAHKHRRLSSDLPPTMIPLPMSAWYPLRTDSSHFPRCYPVGVLKPWVRGRAPGLSFGGLSTNADHTSSSDRSEKWFPYQKLIANRQSQKMGYYSNIPSGLFLGRAGQITGSLAIKP